MTQLRGEALSNSGMCISLAPLPHQARHGVSDMTVVRVFVEPLIWPSLFPILQTGLRTNYGESARTVQILYETFTIHSPDPARLSTRVRAPRPRTMISIT